MTTKAATYTPGPWAITGRDKETDSPATVSAVGTVPYSPICDMYRRNEHNETNARLIAEAPAMATELANVAHSLDALANGEWDDADDGDKERHMRELADDIRILLARIHGTTDHD